MTVQTAEKVDIDGVQQILAEALGPTYRVTVTSDSTLKVGRTGVIPARVRMRTADGMTTFKVQTTGLILSRAMQACSINPRVRRALQRRFSSAPD